MIENLLILAPLLLTLVLALTLRNTLIALGLGTLAGALILSQFDLFETAQYLSQLTISQFYADQHWKSWHIDVLLTMLLLGIMTKLLSRSHAVIEFSQWVHHRIRSPRQARVGVILLGWFVFIDGLFSCLAVGNVCQPLSGKYHIRRDQLAYFVDSNASPVCSLLPFSSWGPFIIALLAGLSFLPGLALSNFIDIAQTNFYAIIALVISFIVAWFGIGFGQAQNQEIRHSDGNAQGSPWLLATPLLTLLIGSTILMLWSGAVAANNWQINDWLTHADVGATMRNASALSVVVTLMMLLFSGREMSLLVADVFHGIKTMWFAITILLFTWLIGSIVKDLKVAALLASWADLYLSNHFLLSGMFILCAVMAFTTGSSWGTFAIMIPIGGEIAHIIHPELLIPALSAVMAGSVFGDHCSPISDTSVLSATSSGCQPHQHVITQLPFAFIGALSALVGFQSINYGLPYAVSIGLVFTTALLVLWIRYGLMNNRQSKLQSNEYRSH
ncbi:sodium:proton antiporter [Parashewanella spongiae]|uniref:Sodium:proton antiporter n=1 Tax=Parashewanella spongiae TaxID=342950 RepID=A0A3A6U2G0_9GAMM|nr:Na+/H+ antiporter NhaC family protein [Parashewanella spongiae]MCL1079676.1 sodium:proton antiporter [Parashewanella spongiae]RJY07052.1 sodium:proton antiporter [Parashewanella spongiae]